MTSAPFTYAVNDLVRCEGRPARVKRIRLNGLVDVWTDYGLRTVNSLAITPARKGDVLLPPPSEYRVRRTAGR